MKIRYWIFLKKGSEIDTRFTVIFLLKGLSGNDSHKEAFISKFINVIIFHFRRFERHKHILMSKPRYNPVYMLTILDIVGSEFIKQPFFFSIFYKYCK